MEAISFYVKQRLLTGVRQDRYVYSNVILLETHDSISKDIDVTSRFFVYQ